MSFASPSLKLRAIVSLILVLTLGAATGAPARTAWGAETCAPSLVSRLLGLIRGERPFQARTPEEVQALAERPEWVLLLGSADSEAARKFSEMGYVRDFAGKGSRKGQTAFRREALLVSDRELKTMPETAARQRALFLERLPNRLGGMSASRRELEFSDFPEHQYLLTVRSLPDIRPGRYSFVQLDDENFLRLGWGHHLLGARRPVRSAGEVEIVRDKATGVNRVRALNPRSDTYRPLPGDLLSALDSLWRQGVPTEELKIFDWDHKTLLIDLK